MNEMEYSSAGLALTRSFEGLRLEAYQDSAGVWTIGCGHAGPEVCAGLAINQQQAEALLQADVAGAVTCVRGAVKVPLTQHQFDALVDFCFNAGRGSFLGSALLQYVNRGDFAGAAGQFGRWVHAGGRVLPGLVRRRAAEAAMFAGRGVSGPGFAPGQQPHPEVGAVEPVSPLARGVEGAIGWK